jgi:hypothetical protein
MLPQFGMADDETCRVYFILVVMPSPASHSISQTYKFLIVSNILTLSDLNVVYI